MIYPFLAEKDTGDSPDQSSSTSSPTPRATKKATVSRGKGKTNKRKPALTKGGLGSFTVFSAPKSKVTIVV
jgi:hypothetical protein